MGKVTGPAGKLVGPEGKAVGKAGKLMGPEGKMAGQRGKITGPPISRTGEPGPPPGIAGPGGEERANQPPSSPTTFPSTRSMRVACGVAGRPGMRMMSPSRATT